MHRFILLASLCVGPLVAQESVVVTRCLRGACAWLEIDGQIVVFAESDNFVPEWRVGTYRADLKRFVPKDEAPIDGAALRNGWRAVVSAALPEYDVYGPRTRCRIFAPDGRLASTWDGDYIFDGLWAGRLFGGETEILAVSTMGVRPLTARCGIWALPDAGTKPRMVLDLEGQCISFRPATPQHAGGVVFFPVLEDRRPPGIRPDQGEFWQWNGSELRRAKAGNAK
jgi:hypothetical protein